MIHYILQVILFQLLFLVVYDVFLKKETFFSYNRIYLVCTTVVSFVIPFIHIEALQQSIPQEYRVQLPAVILGNASETTTNTSVLLNEVVLTQQTASWTSIALGIYLLGLVISFVFFAVKLRKLFVVRKNATLQKCDTYKIAIIPDSDVAFTFLNTIFLGDQLTEPQKENILQHELVHVQQHHSLDLLFFEVLRILCWFNPMVYLYQNKIQALHEYTADRLVASKDKAGYYQNLLSEVFGTTKISFINTFYKSSILKNRIVMLQKSNSKKIVQLKYLLLIPAVCAMLLYTSCSEDVNLQNEEPELSQYTYSRNKGEGITPKIKEIKDNHENFLKENNENYVGWVSKKDDVYTMSIHSKDEKVPEGYDVETRYELPDGQYYSVFRQSKNREGNNVNTIIGEFDNEDFSDVPFSKIQKVPTYPGCEGNNNELKECMSKQIQQFVGENFNTKLANSLNLSGRVRISVQFKINAAGNVVDIRARAPLSDLETEAIRVVSKLPQMLPGEQDGKKVGVIYALPIIFEINE